jgi:hypothetical protein
VQRAEEILHCFRSKVERSMSDQGAAGALAAGLEIKIPVAASASDTCGCVAGCPLAALTYPGPASCSPCSLQGLGEMMPEQLWQTTLNPATRTLRKLTLEDASETEKSASLALPCLTLPCRLPIPACTMLQQGLCCIAACSLRT